MEINELIEKQKEEILSKATLLDRPFEEGYRAYLKSIRPALMDRKEKLTDTKERLTTELDSLNDDWLIENARLVEENEKRYREAVSSQKAVKIDLIGEKTKLDLNSPKLQSIEDKIRRKQNEIKKVESDLKSTNDRLNLTSDLDKYVKSSGFEDSNTSFKNLRHDFETYKNKTVRDSKEFNDYATLLVDGSIKEDSRFSLTLEDRERAEMNRKIETYRTDSEIKRIKENLMSKGVSHESAEAQSRLMVYKGISHDKPGFFDKIKGAVKGAFIGLDSDKGFFSGMKDGWILGTNGLDAISGNIKLEEPVSEQLNTVVNDKNKMGTDLEKVQTEISQIKTANAQVTITSNSSSNPPLTPAATTAAKSADSTKPSIAPEQAAPSVPEQTTPPPSPTNTNRATPK